MDPEQIREEMKLRRASIDRKLDLLAVYTRSAKQRTLHRAIPAVMALAGALVGTWAWKRRRRPKPRQSFRIARAAAAFR